jgi:hypothetical protein
LLYAEIMAEIDCWRRKRRLKPAKNYVVHLSIYDTDLYLLVGMFTSWSRNTHYIELSTKMNFTTSKVLFVHINNGSCTPFISISATSS